MHSKIMFEERNFLPRGARREEITLNLNVVKTPRRDSRPRREHKFYFFTIGQLPSPIGRKASAAGIVSTSL